jgi:predicted nucleic-acid-binding protein
MLAIDTNILVRYLTGDHPKQSRQARTLVGGNDVFVSVTVMLETEWVLRSVYGHTPLQVSRALRAFAGLARVAVESPAVIGRAFDQVERGMDFADALHLGGADNCAAFVTFDKKLVKTARKAGLDTVREPWMA